jgi:hypothetical protein
MRRLAENTKASAQETSAKVEENHGKLPGEHGKTWENIGIFRIFTQKWKANHERMGFHQQ